MSTEVIKALENLADVLLFWSVIWGLFAVWAFAMALATCRWNSKRKDQPK